MAELCDRLAVQDATVCLQRAGGCRLAERSVGGDVHGKYTGDWQGLIEKRLDICDVDVSGVDVGVEYGIGVVCWLRAGSEMMMGSGWWSGAWRFVEGRGQGLGEGRVERPARGDFRIAVKECSVLDGDLSWRIAAIDIG